jgi:hypothetical protein
MHIGFWPQYLEGRDYFGNNHKWDKNIKMDLRKIECECVE